MSESVKSPLLDYNNSHIEINRQSINMVELRVAGKYKLTKKVGSGAFGDIFQGINIKTGEDVAIKLVRNYFQRNPEQL